MIRRTTQSDVAKAAGVHRATVSLAFKNHPSIPAATRQRIMVCAQELDYAPDPMLSSLAAYRSRQRPKAFQGTLAWLLNDFGDWTHVPIYRDYHAGATARAKTHGFNLEIFNIQPSVLNRERLASILRSRNIPGLLLAPQARPNVEMDFPWQEFSAVVLGYSLVRPQLHTVTATQFRAAMRTVRELKARGYRRIGFFFNTEHNEKTDRNYLAGYLVETFSKEGGPGIPPLIVDHLLPAQFRRWYEDHRVDAIVAGNRDVLQFLDSVGIKVPDDLAVACPLVERDSLISGVYEDSFHIGEIAMDFLVAMIHRGERGVPRHPQNVLVEGTWNIGTTVRPLTL